MKLRKLLAILIAACMVLSITAAAAEAPEGDSAQGESVEEAAQGESAEGESGEESGEGESGGESAEGESNGDSGGSGGMGTSFLSVSGDTLTVAEGGEWTLEGDIPTDTNISGIKFVAGSSSESFLSVSAPEHVDALADGFTAILGDDQELYAVPNFAKIYDNEGLNPNSEGFDLDYTWISQIDRDETSDTYGTYMPLTERGKKLTASILDGASYSVWAEGGSKADETSGRGPTQVSVSGGAAVLVQNAFIYSEGAEGLALSNSGSSGVGSTLVVRDSLLAVRGYVPVSANASENMPNDALLVTGSTRTTMGGGESTTYYYNTAAFVDGWASISTDAAQGNGVDLVVVNTLGAALLGGYGSYSDGNCRDFFYGSVLEGAEMGIIMSGTGRVSLFDGDDGLEGGAGYGVGLNGDIDPYAFAEEDYSSLGGSVVAGGRYGVLLHQAGQMSLDPLQYLYVKDSTMLTDRELMSDEDTEFSINASWYGRELSPNIQKYLEYTEGSVIFLRGTNGEVILDNAVLQSYNNVLIRSAINCDTGCPETPAGSNPAGNHITMMNMEAAGDIIDEDYERIMTITMDNATLNGTIVSGTCDSWTQYWIAAGYPDDYKIGTASNTFGAEAPLDGFVHAIVMNDDGTYEVVPYGDDQGTELTLKGGSVWNVTGESNLTALTIEEGSLVNGIVTIEGEEVDTAAGGEWSGQIKVQPAK